MSYSNRFGGIIWTNHALQRLNERKLDQALALQAFQHPDSSFAGKQQGTTEFHKRFERSVVTIIATQNEKKEWIVLSCWVDPPMYGTTDYEKKQKYHSYMKKYRSAGFWGRVWMDIKSILFKS